MMYDDFQDWLYNQSSTPVDPPPPPPMETNNNPPQEDTYMDCENSYDQYYGRGTDNNPKREQKRRPKPKDGTQLICGVCGDKALGYNFDAITCESCKAFFRRNANKTKVFTCSFDGNCKLDTHTRKFCSGCRLKKCFQIGMKKDWILSEEQLAKRRQKGPKPNGPKQRRLDDPRDESMDMPMSSAEATSSNDVMSSTEVSTSYQSDDSTRSPVDSFSSMKSETEEDDFPRPLREDYRLEIENLEHQYAAVFDVPYNEDQFTKLANNPRTPNELFNLTDIFIRRLIKFAKHVPEFKNLQQEDQIHLLKGGIMEIMVLRSAMGFDSKNMAWNVKGASQNTLKEMKLSPDMIKAVDSGIYMEHVRFVMSLNELTRANKTILTLLFVIELFSSDRPSLKNKELVSKGQEKFSAWLKAYLESIYPLSEARQLYPRLLIKLLDVRSLGESSAQLASHLDITRLEPLLVEIFSLQK
ncbi:hypothetical protein FSP39_013806 [Pinctada imbricata]|uniref:Uncharacterized protein n=1 Tax=Pinctada imbricata TaxID=66713 RepID=A0AA88Y6E8_PINIB|nr:hypothetical protein FSP39_013806 [Pinctada imbricata]